MPAFVGASVHPWIPLAFHLILVQIISWHCQFILQLLFSSFIENAFAIDLHIDVHPVAVALYLNF